MSTFGYVIKTPYDLLQKAERELSRFNDQDFFEGDGNELADHALNCAISLWHMVDWLWRSDNPRFKTALTALGVNSFEELHSYVRKQCFALDVCFELATGAKHFKLVQRSKATRTPLIADTRASITSVVELHHTFSHVLKIALVDGQELMAAEVLMDAVEYWRQFLSTNGL